MYKYKCTNKTKIIPTAVFYSCFFNKPYFSLLINDINHLLFKNSFFCSPNYNIDELVVVDHS